MFYPTEYGSEGVVPEGRMTSLSSVLVLPTTIGKE